MARIGISFTFLFNERLQTDINRNEELLEYSQMSSDNQKFVIPHSLFVIRYSLFVIRYFLLSTSHFALPITPNFL